MRRLVLCFVSVLLLVGTGTALAEYRPSAAEVSRMSELLPEIGETQGKDLVATRTIMVGEPFKAGEVAYFFRYLDGSPAWILEEWEGLPDGKFRLTYWRFFFDKEARIYSRVSTGQSIVDGRTARDVYFEVFVDITAEDGPGKLASAKSERVWQLLKKAGKRL